MTVKTAAFTAWIILSIAYGAYFFYLGYTNTVFPDWTHLVTPIFLILNVVVVGYSVYRDRWGNRT